MSLTNSLAAYADIHNVFQSALESNGGIYELESARAAQHWRFRAYQFRKLYRAEYENCPYDIFILTLDDNCVKIDLVGNQGIFRPSELRKDGHGKDGHSVAVPIDDAEDEFLSAAQEVARGLKGED